MCYERVVTNTLFTMFYIEQSILYEYIFSMLATLFHITFFLTIWEFVHSVLIFNKFVFGSNNSFGNHMAQLCIYFIIIRAMCPVAVIKAQGIWKLYFIRGNMHVMSKTFPIPNPLSNNNMSCETWCIHIILTLLHGGGGGGGGQRLFLAKFFRVTSLALM